MRFRDRPVYPCSSMRVVNEMWTVRGLSLTEPTMTCISYGVCVLFVCTLFMCVVLLRVHVLWSGACSCAVSCARSRDVPSDSVFTCFCPSSCSRRVRVRAHVPCLVRVHDICLLRVHVLEFGASFPCSHFAVKNVVPYWVPSLSLAGLTDTCPDSPV